MIETILQNGSEIACNLRNSSDNCNTAHPLSVPYTVGDMLRLWVHSHPRQEAMLRVTCARLADYLGASVDDIPLNLVWQKRKDFRPFLVSRKYSDNSIRTYVNHVRILLNYAVDAGWKPNSVVSEEWMRVIALAVDQRCAEFAEQLAETHVSPRDVTIDDTRQLVLQAAQTVRYDYAVKKQTAFWRILHDCGYAKQLPTYLIREKRYGIPLKEFPAELRSEVEKLLEWKQKAYAWDRPKDARHRPPTTKQLRLIICAVYGYYKNVMGGPEATSLSTLVRPNVIGTFCEWCMAERKVKGQTLRGSLVLLAALLRQHKAYSALDISWFKPLLDTLPLESKAVLKQRKAAKYLDFSVLRGIPAKIHEGRAAAKKCGQKELATLVQNELLMSWLIAQPWRQRNIRECRIGGANPNVFKAALPEILDMDIPNWVAQERKSNPDSKFWQFRFSDEETKMGCAVRALLPKQLVPLLEEFLVEHRQHLLRGNDPGTLFFNQNGRPLSEWQVTKIVATCTLRHGGKRVTPHLFRDIFSFAWLKDHPKDYLTLSKILWHSTPDMVIQTYGARFDESSGVCSVEEWLDTGTAG